MSVFRITLSLTLVGAISLSAAPVGSQTPDAVAPVAGTSGAAVPAVATTANASSTKAAETANETAPIFSFHLAVTPTGREVDSFAVPNSVSVIEEIEDRPVNTAADLLLTEPGVDVNGVGANQTRPIIRGQRGQRVLFLEDGLLVNNPRRQADFGEITGVVDLDRVRAVEVVRGPASVLYGSGAIGGVLNLITHQPPTGGGALTGSLGLRASSADDQRKASANIAGSSERWSYRLDASSRDASDYDAPAGRFGQVTLDDDTRVFDSGVDDDTVSGALLFQASDRQTVSLRSSRYRAGETGFGFVDPALIEPNFDGTKTRIFYPYQDFDRHTLRWSGAGFEGGPASTFDLNVYRQSNERELAFDADINIGPIFGGAPPSSIEIDTLNFTDLDTLGARGIATRGFGTSNLLTYGFDYTDDDLLNTDRADTVITFRFPFPPSVIGVIPGFTCVDFVPPFECQFLDQDSVPNTPNARHQSRGLFAQDEIWATKRLKLVAGARYQEVETRAQPTAGLDVAGLDFDDQQVVGALNVLYAVSDSLHLNATYGTAFRSPNIVERLFNGITPEGSGFQLLNPALESETSKDFDFGVKFRKRNGHFEAAYFRNRINNGIIQHFLRPEEIAALPAGLRETIERARLSFVVQQRNVDRTEIDGVELAAGYRLDNGISFGGNYTHLNSQRIDSSNPPTGDTPSDKANLYVRYEPQRRRWVVEYRLRHNGEQNAVLEPGDPVPVVGEKLPAFTVHSLSGFATVAESGRLSHRLGVVIDNLTDELYAEFTNIGSFRPQIGRNVIVSYRLGLH